MALPLGYVLVDAIIGEGAVQNKSKATTGATSSAAA
jgi:hypothetical protein